MWIRFSRVASFCALLLFLACGGDDDAPNDAGSDATEDASGDVSTDGPSIRCEIRGAYFGLDRIDTTVGTDRFLRLSLVRDVCADVNVAFSVEDDGVIAVPEDTIFETGSSRLEVIVNPQAVGETVLSATLSLPNEEETTVVEIPVRVTDGAQPTCSGSVDGELSAGGAIRMDGTPVGVALAEGASRADQFRVENLDIEVACASDIVPEGYIPLGPAVRFSPDARRFPRPLRFTLPAELALMPSRANRGDIVLAYQGPGVQARVVPVASPDVVTDPGFVHFEAPRFGTYQAVTRAEGRVARERTFTYRGITGVSMGSGGSASIGIHNPDRFDFIGPLGGPVDWVHMLHQIRTYHLGGFCTEVERQADPEGCAAGASMDRVPPTDLYGVPVQDFEHWNYDEAADGQGGTFDRRNYIRIFRDLAMMFGNPNSTRSLDPDEPNVTPPGVPDSERMRTDAERCAEPVIIPPCSDPESGPGACDEGTGFFDEEFNPEGRYQMITFCDAAELAADNPRGRDIGTWDPEGANNFPIEVALAIDINGNGRRDPGEPVPRMGRENFEDCGLDQLCNADEEGYDPLTNPDPAGDDYDFQYNPLGTEGNWRRDYVGTDDSCESPEPSPAPGQGERFEDVGLDGVAGTRQLGDGGFDTGEGDGCWTLARGTAHMFENNPRDFVLRADENTLRDLDFWSDGGLRDLFGFSSNQDQLLGAFAARGFPVNLYHDHSSLSFSGLRDPDAFSYREIDWTSVGKFVHVRYGDPDASEEEIAQGDGHHVGNVVQITNRLLSVLAWMNQRWPDGDRARVRDTICDNSDENCEQPNFLTYDFTAEDGRTGPVSIVLPPGYFDEAYADVDYPVVYLLHGYGMEPQDLIATGLLTWTFMTAATIPEAERYQKMIFVFPDGSCGEEECIRGSFYVDSPERSASGAQMESFMLDLMDHVDENYRTRDPETFTVYE